jgi:hypothetical protein
VARRVGTLDPVLVELRAELRERLPARPLMPQRDIDRRRAPRMTLACPARLRVGVLGVGGTVRDVGVGGLFLASDVLVEAGERGQLELPELAPVGVRIMWTRGSTHPLGQGLGMAFEQRNLDEERRVLELVIALLDADRT